MSSAKPDVIKVFDAWAAHVGGKQKKLSTVRIKLIERALKDRTSDELVKLFRWVFESKDSAAVWLRGEAERSEQAYTDLSNLLVMSKLDKRCERAAEWLEEISDEEDEPEENSGVSLPAWVQHTRASSGVTLIDDED